MNKKKSALPIVITMTMVFLLACVSFVSATPAPTAAIATATFTTEPTVLPQATAMIPDYAAGVQWKDINGDTHMFMVEDPPMEQYEVELANWFITIPNTDQTITVLRYGEPRGSILVGVWTYTHEDETNLLVDVAVMGATDSGIPIEDLRVSFLDQTAQNMQLSQLKFSKDLIGASAKIEPLGFDCQAIPSDPDGNISETDGSSAFVAFICKPPTNPIG